MIAKTKSISPAAQEGLRALRKAAKNARKLAEETQTPFLVMRKGKLINLNPNARKISAAEIRERQLNKNF